MKQVSEATPDARKRARIGGQTAFVIGLSATGAVFFSAAHAQPAPFNGTDRGEHSGRVIGEHSDRVIPRKVEKDLRVSARDIKREAGGIQFTSRDYAEALNMDRASVVRALQTNYPGIRDEQIKVAGDRIFIGNGGGAAMTIFDNLCLHVTLNICRKS